MKATDVQAKLDEGNNQGAERIEVTDVEKRGSGEAEKTEHSRKKGF